MKSAPFLMAIAITVATTLGFSTTVTAAESSAGPYIIMLGAPGAGKSTNSKNLAAQYDIPWINVGEAVEKAVAAQQGQSAKKGKSKHGPRKIRANYQAQRAQKTDSALQKLRSGELVDDDSLNAIVASKVLGDGSNGFVLDGYPMTVQQATFLDSLLDARGIEDLDIIYLNVPDKVALQRMKERGRVDDVDGLGEERLRQFRDWIQLVLDYYGDEVVVEIDATQSKAKVAGDISSALK